MPPILNLIACVIVFFISTISFTTSLSDNIRYINIKVLSNNTQSKIRMKVVALLSLCLSLTLGQVAQPCDSSKCTIENNCRCSSPASPLASGTPPQLLALTVSESVVTTLFDLYWNPILWDRTNPDGGPIGATFFVNHEYTDYKLVNALWARGFEIGVHSITKNSSMAYWQNANFTDIVQEFEGQRQILNNFANIPTDEIVGGRIPQLILEGDTTVQGLVRSGLQYDNSWSTRSDAKLFPYTLDYASIQKCQSTVVCPKNSYPGFWIAPITNIQGAGGIECNSLATCNVEGTADEIAAWLRGQLDESRNGGRVPLVLRLDSYWFQFTENSYEGFVQFLDNLPDDVYLVGVRDIISWVKNPVPVEQYTTPTELRDPDCDQSHNCQLDYLGSIRYMDCCVDCPDVYPWKGNPGGEN